MHSSKVQVQMPSHKLRASGMWYKLFTLGGWLSQPRDPFCTVSTPLILESSKM